MNQPQTVWRVEPIGNGLTSRGHPNFQDNQDFESQRRRHLGWDHEFSSPFLSTFSSQTHAIRWGRRQAILWGRAYYDDVVVYEINTGNLQMHRGRQPDEYLIVGAIPQSSIRHMTSLRDEVDRLTLERMERMLNGRFRPEKERYPGAYGWFSDEDDALDDIDYNNDFEYALNH